MSENPGKSTDFSNIQENLNQQQAKILALKELVRQSESSQGRNLATDKEKVKNIAQRLTSLKTKAQKGKYKLRAHSEASEEYGGITNIQEEQHESMEVDSVSQPTSTQVSVPSTPRARSETPGSEKIIMLRKQMEENRLRMAERESQKREIEQMVDQLKSQLESSQMSLEKSVEFGRSMTDLTTIPLLSPLPVREHNRSVSDVSIHPVDDAERIKFLEKRIRELEESPREESESERVQQLERRILDLEENLKEKESIIDARTKAVSLLTENMSKKRKDVVDSLEDTKQEMFKMQESFVEDVERLNIQLDEKSNQVKSLEEANYILEKARYDLTLENSELRSKLDGVQDYSTKISELNKLNESLQKRISDLESQKYEFITDEEIGEAKQATIEDSEEYKKLCEKISELEKENVILKENIDSDKLKMLEELVENKNLEIESMKKTISDLEESVQEKTIEYNVLNASFNVLQEKYNSMGSKSLFPESSADENLQAEITKLKQQLDDSNKSNIKTKLKMKQLQKQIDGFKKLSNANQEIAKLTQEVETLTQKVAELEEEKGNLQLHLVNYDGNVPETELAKRIKVLEATCQNQTSAIQLLEEQKLDITDDLNTTKYELETLKDSVKEQKQADNVKSEIASIEIEENLEKVKLENKQLRNQLEELQNSNEDLEKKIEKLTEEKIELQVKLDGYINENMELLDKIEKLSLEKVSSAESIEMVGNLTQQEKLEFEKSVHGKGDDAGDHEETEENTEISEELNDSLVKLREESSELMQKIELFTTERREVLEKLERREEENLSLKKEIEQLIEEKTDLECENEKISKELSKAEELVEDLKKEKDNLSTDIRELNEHRSKLQEEINKLVKEELVTSTHSSPLRSGPESPESEEQTVETFNKEECEKLLKSLDQEIQNYSKNKDKNKKIQLSKKLSHEAKNVHNLMVKLVQEYFKNVEENSSLKDEVERLKIHLNDLVSLDHSEDDLKKAEVKLDDMLQKLSGKEKEFEVQLEEMSGKITQKNQEMKDLKSSLDNLETQIVEKDKCIETMEKTIDLLTKEREEYQQELEKQITQVSQLKKNHDKLEADINENKQNLHKKCVVIEELRHEFDMKLKTTTSEIEILKTLVAEQKQLLIDSYQEHEVDMNQKMKEIQDYQNQIQKLQDEIKNLTDSKNKQDNDDLEELRSEKLSLEKLLKETQELLDQNQEEFKNKQDTIDSLNNQIIELYKTMEENSNKLIEKDDEIQYLQELNSSKQDEIQSLHDRANVYSKTIADLEKKLNERVQEIENLRMEFLNASDDSKIVLEKKIKELEGKVLTLTNSNKDLEAKNKEQLEKLKKFAANLKKKSHHCTELEEKLSKSGNSEEMMSLKSKIVEYEDKLRLIALENSKLSENLQQSSNDSTKIQDLQSEIWQMKEKIDYMEEENWKLSEQNKQLDQEKSGAVREFETLSQRFYQLQDSYGTVEMKYRELYQNSGEIEKDLKKTCEELLTAEQQKVSLQAEVKKFQEHEEEMKKKMDKCKAAVATLKNKLNEKKNRVEELEKEIEGLKNKSQDQDPKDSKEHYENEIVKLQQEMMDREKQMNEFYNNELDKLRVGFQEQEDTLKQSYEQGLKNALEEELSKLTQHLETQALDRENTLKTQCQQTIDEQQTLFQTQMESYQQQLNSLRSEYSELEKSNQMLSETSERKFSLEGQLESIEQENLRLKEKITKLEEAVSFVEARRNSLERQKRLMDQEFMERTQAQAENEDLLLQRLNALTVQDELIEQKLRSSEEENLELTENLLEAKQEKEMMIVKINDLENEMKKMQEFSEKANVLEQLNNKLEQQIELHQTEIKRQHQEFQEKLASKHAEIDEMESELSTQLQRVEVEKKTIQEALEKTQDQIVDFQDEVIRLKDQIHTLEQNKVDLERELSWAKLQNDNYTQDQLENQELRMQLMQERTEIEDLRQQNDAMLQNHTSEVTQLRQQINDLETMRSRVSQNQTDDQVELQNENLRLKELLDQHQQKILQLQMSINASQNDPFAAIVSKNANPPSAIPQQRVPSPSTAHLFQQPTPSTAQFFQQQSSVPIFEQEIIPSVAIQQESVSETPSLEERLRVANEEIEKLRENSVMMSVEMEAQNEKIRELTRANHLLQNNLQEMNSIRESLIKSNTEFEHQVIELQQQIEMKNNEVDEIKKEVEVLRGFTSQIPEKVTDEGKIQALENELLEKKDLIEKLHQTLEKYEKKDQEAQPSGISTAMFFGGAAEELDSIFSVPSQPMEPVVEETIKPRRAYICHEDSTQTAGDETSDEWGWGDDQAQTKQQIQELENVEHEREIINLRNYIKELEEKLNDFVALERDQSVELQRQTDKLKEYEDTIEQMRSENFPVVQEVVEAQVASTSTASHPIENLAALEIEDGDGWYWGADNVMEQQQFQQKSLLSPRANLEVKLQEEHDRVEALTSENQALNEELLNLKEKSKKMMSKLKEYQVKIKDIEARNARKSSSVESNELDLAIQEELKLQLAKMESRLKEVQSEMEKEQQEKQSLIKRIDVLSAANDRFTEMKDRQDSQMELYQLKIKDLNEKLQRLEEWGDESEEKPKTPAASPSKPADNTRDLQKRIDELTDMLKDQQVDFDEVQALLEEEKSNNAILESKIQKLQTTEQNQEEQKAEEIEKLERQLKDITNQRDHFRSETSAKDAEIRDLISKIDLLSNESNNIKRVLEEINIQNQLKTNQNDELTSQLESYANKNAELQMERSLYDKSIIEQHKQELEEMEKQIQTLSADLQYKDAEILHLNERIQSQMKEDQTESLVQEILLKNQELATLRERVKCLESEKVELENNLSLQISQQLKEQVDQNSQGSENVELLKKRIQELEKNSKDFNAEKQQMEQELQVLNDQVMASIAYEDKMKGIVLDLDAKDMEIQMLKNSLEQMKQKLQVGNVDIEKEKEKLEANYKAMVDTLNAQWSQKVEQRGSEIATKWREYCEAKETDFAQIEADLKKQLEEVKSVQIAEVAGEEEEPELDRSRSEEFARMKDIMEAQEVEIVSLKEQLAIRSAELGQLASRVDPYRQLTSSNISLSSIPPPDTVQVPRSEYDLLLYVSEQREMRCAEMELELRNLLGERDTLQLRLSNAIRQIEDIRMRHNISPEQESLDVSKTTTPEKQPTSAPAVLLVGESESGLQTKISEISSAKQSRERTFREEKEQRFNQRSLIERDLANLPPEAKAQIAGSSSEQVQSPSSLLLNWILGKKSSDST